MKITIVKFLKLVFSYMLMSAFVFTTCANAQTLDFSLYELETETTQLNTRESEENKFISETVTESDDTKTDEEGKSIAGNIKTTLASTSGGTWIKASNGRWWYKHTDGTYTKNNWEQIDGKWYYFDADGWMITGWQKIDGYWYYFKPGDSGWMVTGWCNVGVNRYYLGTDGKMRTGWQKIDGYWYYFNPGDSGKMLAGWQKISSVWYYLGTDGKMCTGWKQISGNWYYLGSDGKMRTGWQTIDGKKYYFKLGDSGRMLTGWQKIDGDYYYFGGGGVMQTSPFSDSFCYYVFYSSGKLRKVEDKIVRRSQEKTSWCWAACAQMTGEFITGTRKTQSSIVAKIKGTAVNEGATISETTEAANFACGNQNNWQYYAVSNFSFQEAVDILNKRKTFEVRYRWSNTSGHILVCAGYDLEEQKLQIVDPWQDCNTTYYKYTDLCAGTQIQTGYGWLAGVFKY